MDAGQQSIQESPSRGTIIWLAAICLCVLFGLSHSFSSMAIYDDESYIMMTIKTFLEGDRLYGETYPQYGPAYYMIQQPIHGWLGIPVSHDVMRLKTVATWVLIGLLSGLAVTRLTESRFAGVVAMMLSVMHLDKLGLEPAHPQEVVALLSSLCLILMSSRNRWLLLLVGVCAAFAGLAKLNVGAVVAVGCLFAAGFTSPDSKRISRLFGSVGAILATGLAAAVFVAVAKSEVATSEPFAIAWPSIIFASAALVATAAWSSMRRPSEEAAGLEATGPDGSSWFLHPMMIIVAGGLAGVALVISWAVMHSNSLREILHGVVFQHGFMSDAFHHPVHADRLAMLIAVPAIVLLLIRFWKRDNNGATETVERILFALPPIVLAIASYQIAIGCLVPLSHGLKPRGAALFLATAGPVMMPILLLRENSQLRRTLAMIGCLSPVLAFPVPGTQVSLGTLPILVGLVVLTHDLCASKFAAPLSSSLLFRRTAIGVAGVMVLVTGVFGYRWANNTALDLPGCHWVRLDADRVAKERDIVEFIRQSDSQWLAFDTHNHNRFFFWAGKKPLTSTSPTFWPAMLTDSEKLKIESAARQAESICVVKLNNKHIELGDYAPAISDVFFESWQMRNESGDWQVGVSRP